MRLDTMKMAEGQREPEEFDQQQESEADGRSRTTKDW